MKPAINTSQEDLIAIEIQARLKRIKQPVTFKGKPLPEKAIILFLLKKLPLLSGFLQSIDRTGNALSKLATIKGHVNSTFETIRANFQWVNLGLSFLDFFRIPLIYLAAVLIGQKPPISLSKNARWVYSAVLLSLTLISIFVPATAAPIAFIGAALGLLGSIFLLTRHAMQRHHLKIALKDVNKNIASEKEKLQQIQQRATVGVITQQELELMEKEFEEQKEKLQQLHDQQIRFQQKLEKMNIAGTFDKSTAMGLSTAGMIGLTLALFFPIIGLKILAITAVIGSIYILTRLVYTIATALLGCCLAKASNKEEDDVSNDLSPKNLQSMGVAMSKLQTSTPLAPDQQSATKQQEVEDGQSESIQQTAPIHLPRLFNKEKPTQARENLNELIFVSST